MSVIRTVLPLPKNTFHCLLHRAGNTHSSSGTVSATLLIHKKICFKKTTFLQTCKNLQSYNARFFFFFYILCQTKYWFCYNASGEYVTKIIHSTRSVQNRPNLSNEACVLTCIQRCKHGSGLVRDGMLLPERHRDTKAVTFKAHLD